jgi:hypothetical protein
MGGTIELSTPGGTLTTTGAIAVDGKDGGAQSGKGGKGGAGGPTGGNGGDVLKSGKGGNGGTVSIRADSEIITQPATFSGGLGGNATGEKGLGGFGSVTPGLDGQTKGKGDDGLPGHLVLAPWPTDDDVSEGDLKKRMRKKTVIALQQDSDLIPVSYVQSIAPPAVPLAESNSGLRAGATLFAPEKEAITVETPEGVLHIAAGSQALVEVIENATVVRTLHNHKRGDVRMVVGATTLIVDLGRQVVISSGSSKALHAFNSNSAVAVRNTMVRKVGNGITAAVSEFSMVSALSSHEVLKALYQSADKADRKHLEQILKNAVVLSFTTAGKGRYQRR